MISKDTIWIGKRPRAECDASLPPPDPPDAKEPRWLTRGASLASVIGTTVAVCAVFLGIAFGYSARMAILEEHDKQAQERFKSYDSLVIQRTQQITEIQADLRHTKEDVTWIREHLEKGDRR